MFGNMKKHGSDLVKNHLRHFLRFSWLTLAEALFYVWLVSVGTIAIHAGFSYPRAYTLPGYLRPNC